MNVRSHLAAAWFGLSRPERLVLASGLCIAAGLLSVVAQLSDESVRKGERLRAEWAQQARAAAQPAAGA